VALSVGDSVTADVGKLKRWADTQMFRWIKRTRRRIRDWFKDRSRYLRWQWHRVTSGTLAWWESLKTTHEDGPVSVAEPTGGKRGRPALKFGSFFNPFFWLSSTFQFLLRYLFSRRPIDFVVSVPGIFGVVAPFASLYAWLPAPDALTARYSAQMQVFSAAKDFENARFYANCWKVAQPSNLEVDLAISLLDDAAGNIDASRQRLRELIFRYQYEPAVILYARRQLPDLVKNTATWTAEATEVQQILAALLQIQPDQVDAGFMLSTLYVAHKQWRDALTLLRQFAGRPGPLQANFLYTKAVVEAELGYLVDSRRSASEGSDLLVRQLTLTPTNQDLLIQTVQCLTLAGREIDGAQLLRDRLPRDVQSAADSSPQEQQLRMMLAGVLASRCRRLRMEPLQTGDSVAEAVSCLSASLRLAPNNGMALEELSRLALADLSGEPEVAQDLQALLDSGIEPGLMHFVLGSQALKRGSSGTAEAAAHFEKALAHGAGFPGLLNNFANLVVDNENGDIEAADRMISEALKQLPNQAELYDTRGKIRLRQGRVSEAIADFELALKEPRIRNEVYVNLAKACRLAGDDTSARRYEQLAKGKPLSQ